METDYRIRTYHYNYSKVAVYQQSKSGCDDCGDQYFIHENDRYLILAIADGLGSGSEACKASETAVGVMEDCHALSSWELIHECNEALHRTRGVVLGIAKLDYTTWRFDFCGVGNIQFVMFPYQQKMIRCISTPGFLAGRKIRVKNKIFSCREGETFAMFSDGIAMDSSWEKQLRSMQKPEEHLETIIKGTQLKDDDITLILGRT